MIIFLIKHIFSPHILVNLDWGNVTSYKDYRELYKNLSNGFPVALVMGIIQMRVTISILNKF